MSLKQLQLQIELNNMNKKALAGVAKLDKSLVSNGISNGYKNLWKTPEQVKQNYLISNPIISGDISQYFKTPDEDINDYIDRIEGAEDLPITFQKMKKAEETEDEYVARIRNQLLKLQGTMNSQKVYNREKLRKLLLTVADPIMVDAILNSELFKDDFVINEVLNSWNKLIKDIKTEYSHIDAKIFLDYVEAFLKKKQYKIENPIPEEQPITQKQLSAETQLNYEDENSLLDNFSIVAKQEEKAFEENAVLFNTLVAENVPILFLITDYNTGKTDNYLAYLKKKERIGKPYLYINGSKIMAYDYVGTLEVMLGQFPNLEQQILKYFKPTITAFKVLLQKKYKTLPLIKNNVAFIHIHNNEDALIYPENNGLPQWNIEPIGEGKGEEKQPTIGTGLRKYKPKNIEQGLKLDDNQNKYIGFGKFVLNSSKLEDNILRVFYAKTFLNVGKIKSTHISDDFKDLIFYIIQNKKFSEKMFNLLNAKEKELFKILIEMSGIRRLLKIKIDIESISKSYKSPVEEKLERWKILVGELNVGNDNPLIFEECRQIAKYLLDIGHINKIHYKELMQELIDLEN